MINPIPTRSGPVPPDNANTRRHFFPVQQLTVFTEAVRNGYRAYCPVYRYKRRRYSPIGYGETRLEAIAHLRDQLVDRGLLEQP